MVVMDDYRFGLLVGAVGAWGLMSVLESSEYLVFGGLVLDWTVRRAVIGLGLGFAQIALALAVHRWYGSLRGIVIAESGVDDAAE